MIIVVALRALFWQVPHRARKFPLRMVRRLPFAVHLRGLLLPPWPNYGVPRVRSRRGRR